MPHCTESNIKDTGLDCLVRIARFHQIAHEHGIPLESFDADDADLPGGQRRRIAIAWTLLSKLCILNPGKAGSALDYASGRIILHNIGAMQAGLAVIERSRPGNPTIIPPGNESAMGGNA